MIDADALHSSYVKVRGYFSKQLSLAQAAASKDAYRQAIWHADACVGAFPVLLNALRAASAYFDETSNELRKTISECEALKAKQLASLATLDQAKTQNLAATICHLTIQKIETLCAALDLVLAQRAYFSSTAEEWMDTCALLLVFDNHAFTEQLRTILIFAAEHATPIGPIVHFAHFIGELLQEKGKIEYTADEQMIRLEQFRQNAVVWLHGLFFFARQAQSVEAAGGITSMDALTAQVAAHITQFAAHPVPDVDA